MVCYINILNVIYFWNIEKRSQIFICGIKKKLSFILLSKMQKIIYNRTGAFPGHSPAAFLT